jgi:hypothetical protein
MHLKATVSIGLAGLGPVFFFLFNSEKTILYPYLELIIVCKIIEINVENNVTHIVRNTILRLCKYLTTCGYAVRNIIIHSFRLFGMKLYYVRFEVLTMVTEEYSLQGCNVM